MPATRKDFPFVSLAHHIPVLPHLLKSCSPDQLWADFPFPGQVSIAAWAMLPSACILQRNHLSFFQMRGSPCPQSLACIASCNLHGSPSLQMRTQIK